MPVNLVIYFTGSRSDLKLLVEVNGYSFEKCSNLYQNTPINLSNKQLCAGREDSRKDTCNGDSGLCMK